MDNEIIADANKNKKRLLTAASILLTSRRADGQARAIVISIHYTITTLYIIMLELKWTLKIVQVITNNLN